MIDYKKINILMGTSLQQKVLVHLLNVDGGEDYLSGIALAIGISHSNIRRLAEPLIDSGILTERLIGKQIKMLSVNEGSPITKELRRSFETLSQLIE